MEERFISHNLKVLARKPGEVRPSVFTGFTARQTPSKKWIVGFFLNETPETLTLKRKNCDGDRSRLFARLSGVEQWMRKMGISEFTVHPYFGKFQCNLNQIFK